MVYFYGILPQLKWKNTKRQKTLANVVVSRRNAFRNPELQPRPSHVLVPEPAFCISRIVEEKEYAPAFIGSPRVMSLALQ